MKIIDLKTGERCTLSSDDRVCCALGNFDGVHLGHRALLGIAASKPNCTKSAVWTFSTPSSRTVGGVSLLTDPEERLTLFRECGIELALISEFQDVRGIDADIFAKNILYEQCRVRYAVCGFNFKYGNRAAGNASTLKSTLATLGAQTHIVPQYEKNGVIVSSSEIRAALTRGDMETVAEMLARPYSLSATVLHGKQLGRKLGFPTANQQFPIGRAVPRFGVYAVRCTVRGKRYHGIANVGVRPTVEQTDNANCEVYLFDFDGSLYGEAIQTEFLHFLREERRFTSVEALKNAVDQNILQAKTYFEKEEAAK